MWLKFSVATKYMTQWKIHYMIQICLIFDLLSWYDVAVICAINYLHTRNTRDHICNDTNTSKERCKNERQTLEIEQMCIWNQINGVWFIYIWKHAWFLWITKINSIVIWQISMNKCCVTNDISLLIYVCHIELNNNMFRKWLFVYSTASH